MIDCSRESCDMEVPLSLSVLGNWYGVLEYSTSMIRRTVVLVHGIYDVHGTLVRTVSELCRNSEPYLKVTTSHRHNSFQLPTNIEMYISTVT